LFADQIPLAKHERFTMNRFLRLPVSLLMSGVFAISASADWIDNVIPPHAILAMTYSTYPEWDYVEYPYWDAPPHMNSLRYVGRTLQDHSGYDAIFIVRIPNESFQPSEARGRFTGYTVRYAPDGDLISCVHVGYDTESNEWVQCYDPYFNGSKTYEIFSTINLDDGTAHVHSQLTIR
ncbi:MAG: hypothetical protein AB7E49_11160, partial [Campylobacterales bacterium]